MNTTFLVYMLTQSHSNSCSSILLIKWLSPTFLLSLPSHMYSTQLYLLPLPPPLQPTFTKNLSLTLSPFSYIPHTSLPPSSPWIFLLPFSISRWPSELIGDSWQVTRVVKPCKLERPDEWLREQMRKLELSPQEGKILMGLALHRRVWLYSVLGRFSSFTRVPITL